jgi:hypothetical protein
LVPLVKISYTQKATGSTKLDDIEEKLRDHYGVIYTDASKYQTEVLNAEKTLPKFGTKISEIDSAYDVHKVCLNEANFDERQFYL